MQISVPVLKGEEMITLQSDCLRVEIAEPGEHPNDCVRFDRAGFITDVVLNNDIHFCASENRNNIHPTTYGRGLCCEYQMRTDGEAQVGERYPKLGVGLILKEDDKPYTFTNLTYDIEYFPVDIEASKSQAVFKTGAIPCLGYAAEQTKTVTVEGNTLTVEWEFKNVGEKEIKTGEYCHNFINVDGMAMSPDYVLETPMLKDFGNEPLISNYTKAPSNLIGCGHGFTFAGCDNAIILTNPDITGLKEEIPFKWRLVNKAAKGYIEPEDYYVPSSICFWITDHLFSPEFIQMITIAPGQSASWKRKMTFACEW